MSEDHRVRVDWQPKGTDLAGRRLLVAGDRGTAAAVAGEAVRCGAVVIVATDVHGDGDGSPEGHAIRYDGRSEADIERTVDMVLEGTPGLDGMIVAIAPDPLPPLEEGDLESWERCITQPLRTTFWLVRRGVHELLAAGRGGHLVMVVAGGRGNSELRSAWILEGALVSLARSIAKEYGRRAITCNVVAGGSTSAAPREVVDAALFLASPAAGFVTGECLRVAGDAMGSE